MTTPMTTAQTLADRLTSWGFGIYSPGWEDAVKLKITSTGGGVSELTVSSAGHITWDSHSFNGRHASPAHLISVVLDLLNPAWEEGSSAARLPVVPDRSLQGLIGRALIKSRMRVASIQRDAEQQSFGTFAEIIITNPRQF